MGIKYYQRKVGTNIHDIRGISDRERVDPWSKDVMYPSAEVQITPPSESPNFDSRYGDGYIDYNDRWDEGDTPSTELFTHKPSKIHTAFVDHSLQLSAGPVVLGHAMNKLQSWGGVPEVSESLSAHSSVLAQRAASMGLVKGPDHNAELSKTNNIAQDGKGTFENHVGPELYKTITSGDGGWKEISPEDVGAAKDTVRKLAKGKPEEPTTQPHMGPQFDQLRLF
jgi:hypothetical protein